MDGLSLPPEVSIHSAGDDTGVLDTVFVETNEMSPVEGDQHTVFGKSECKDIGIREGNPGLA
jgi:hypothetical protein